MMMTKTMQKIMYALFFLLLSQLAQAKLEIEIIQGNASALPIAIIPMQWRASDPPPQAGVSEIISSDLHRSGLFDPLDEQDMVDRPVDAESIRYGTWRLLKVDYLVIGQSTLKPEPGNSKGSVLIVGVGIGQRVTRFRNAPR